MDHNRMRVLYIYRDLTPPANLTAEERFMFRWRRVCEEMATHISRMKHRFPHEDIDDVADEVFHQVGRLVGDGYLRPSKEPAWSIYKLTNKGREEIARWKQADFP